MGQFHSNPQPKDLGQAIVPLAGFFTRLSIVVIIILPPLVFCTYKWYFFPVNTVLEGLAWIGVSFASWVAFLAALAQLTGHSLRDIWKTENIKSIWVKVITGLALILIVVFLTILVFFIVRWNQSNAKQNQPVQSDKILILVAEFSEGANYEIPSDRTTSYLLYNELQNLRIKDPKIEVVRLNEVILDRNTAIKIVGEKDAAAIIWGTYTLSPTHARIDVHLQPSPLIGVFSQDYLEEPIERTASISEWYSFTLHSDLTNEMSYLVSFVSGLANYSDHQLDQALIDFDAAINYSMKSQALGLESVFYYKGLIFRQQKRYSEAEIEFNRAIKENPSFAPAYNNLGLTYQDQNRLDDAVTQYNKAINANSRFATAYSNLALAYGIQGKPIDERISLYLTALQIEPNNFIFHQNLGILYQDQGKYSEALSEYKKAVSNYPYDAYTYFNLATLYREIGNWEDAIAACQKSIEIDPNNASYHNLLGLLYSDIGRASDDSITEYKKALEINPNFAPYHGNLGLEYEYAGKLEQAQIEYESATRLAPDNPVYLCRLGELYVERGDEQQGLDKVAECEKIVLNNSSIPSWHNELGMTYLAIKDNDKALQELKTAVALDFTEYVYHENLSNAYEEAGRIQEAITEAEIALHSAPNPSEYHFRLASLRWKYRDYIGSIKSISLAVYKAPLSLKAVLVLYFVFLVFVGYFAYVMINKPRRERFGEKTILAMIQGVLFSATNIRELVIKTKILLTKSQNVQLGLSRIQNKLSRFIAILYHTQSNIDFLGGREKNAIHLLEKSLEVDPLYSPAIDRLVPYYANRGDLTRAHRLAIQAIRNTPNDITMRIAVGDIEFVWGAIEKAVDQWKDAININVDAVIELRFEHLRTAPLYIPAHFNIGLAYKAKGELKKALVGFDITMKSSQNRVLKYLAKKEIENLHQ